MAHQGNISYREYYTLTVMVCLVLSLLLLIGLVKFWPSPQPQVSKRVYSIKGQEAIQMEEIVITQQAQQIPPPPAPLPPVIVPDDRILEETELDISDSFLQVDTPALAPEATQGTEQGPPTQLTRVDNAPKPVRFVEPEYTREAQRKKIRAEIVIEVLVDDKGKVQEAKVQERYLINAKDGSKTPVENIGYGLEEAALSAAQRWLFRPGRENGKVVKSYTLITFTFGV